MFGKFVIKTFSKYLPVSIARGSIGAAPYESQSSSNFSISSQVFNLENHFLRKYAPKDSRLIYYHTKDKNSKEFLFPFFFVLRNGFANNFSYLVKIRPVSEPLFRLDQSTFLFNSSM